jgi:hypothetical protein
MSPKKNKKSFSDNLELLFSERMLDDAQDNIHMIENDNKKTSNKKEKGATATRKKSSGKKSSRKSFSSNLEQFFKDSIEGVLDGVVTDVKRKIVGKGNKKAVGLDLLIRQTTKDNINDKSERQKPQTKRVTVVLDTKKIDELKRIAKEEKLRLHQIIGELVKEYIDEMNKD